MHRARLVLNKLNPIIPNAGDNVRFGTWLLRQNVSKIAVSPQTKYYSAAAAAEPFLNGSSSAYVEEMYNAWLADPKSVHVSWDAFFRSSSSGAAPGQAYNSPPSLAVPRSNEVPISTLVPMGGTLSAFGGGSVSEKIIDDHLAVQAIIRSYQVRGHLVADLDPIQVKFGNGTLFYNRHGQPDPSVVRDYLFQIEILLLPRYPYDLIFTNEESQNVRLFRQLTFPIFGAACQKEFIKIRILSVPLKSLRVSLNMKLKGWSKSVHKSFDNLK